MKSIQTTALVLWMAIFIAAAFFVGQFLASKEIFDITPIITGDRNEEETDKEDIGDDTLANDVVIDKIGQETVRIGLNIASDYFSLYYKDYINYIINNIDKYSGSEKVIINDTLASDYVFYAIPRNIDTDKYKSSESGDRISITEAEINSFADKMFGKDIDESFKKDGKYGYDKLSKKYSIDKNTDYSEWTQELSKIENITSNELVLTFSCKKNGDKNSNETIKLTCLYKGGRYIVTEVEI